MDLDTAIETHEPATVKDTTHIKGWLVEMGWKPTQYKERDLTCDSKKNKLTPEKFQAAVERYVEQTLESPFCKDRCDELGCSPATLREAAEARFEASAEGVHEPHDHRGHGEGNRPGSAGAG
jgi:hypothetical protein